MIQVSNPLYRGFQKDPDSLKSLLIGMTLK